MYDNNRNIKALPRMRTVPEAAAEIKAADPNTAITEYHIRQLALQGVLPRVKAGRKLLINLDTLIEYLTDPTAEKFQVHNTTAVKGGIRRIV
ncbi:MAG: DNA-binding protein [Ruminococcus sp.]|nr:DNA-binding protein [Ruminococcus sp.]